MNRYALALTAAILPAVLTGAKGKANELGPREASDLIALNSKNGVSADCLAPASSKFDIIQNPDGTTTKFSGIIPKGKVLVITGFSFVADTSEPAGRLLCALIAPAKSSFVFSRLVEVCGVSDGRAVTGSVSLTTGVRVTAGPDLCFAMLFPTPFFEAHLYGYQTKN